MKVKAAAGVRVPHEDAPHKYITDAEAVEVENTIYYRRRIADGDLIAVNEPAQAVKNTQKIAKVEG